MMRDSQVYSQQNWAPVIHGCSTVHQIPGSLRPINKQVIGSAQNFWIRDAPKSILKYPYPNTEIHLMSVLQTRDWIWNLGSSLHWAYKESWFYAISFCNKQIDGNQLVNMDVEDLRKLNIVKKLGHRLAIVKAVKAIQRKSSIMDQRFAKYNGYLDGGSQPVGVPFLIESYPFSDYLALPKTVSNELTSQNKLKVGWNLGKYQRLRPSRHNPMTSAFSRLPVPNNKSLSSEIPIHMEKGSVSTANVRTKPRAHIATLKAKGESEERGNVTQSDCGEQKLGAYHENNLCEKSE